MPPTKIKKRASWVSLAGLVILLGMILTSMVYRQQITDAVMYYQYQPTPAVEEITADSNLTNEAKFIFYASHPAVEASNDFNKHCERKEADSPILGCYSAGRTYIFDVTDERLDGIEVVTASHELLHAVYERLSIPEKERVTELLQAEYKKVGDGDLKKRMAYYERTEPGESINELHSIIGTEYASISPALESYYKKYFNDRSTLVSLHAKVNAVFEDLSEEADDLIDRIELLAGSINNDTKQYNIDVQSLNADVAAFNTRARSNGGFTTQAEFEAARQELLRESERLNTVRQTIEANINRYKGLLARLDAINSESASLNQSLDSTLSEVPTV